MKTQAEVVSADVGIIVGRFQTHELHEAHIDLIQTVCNRHDKVILFLGLSPLKFTRNNPLDFETRKQMVLERFPRITILYIKDCYDDEVWSKRLDEQISDNLGASQSVVLYGGRDSFIKCYTGKYQTVELVPESYISASELRKTISRSVMNDAKFRAGIIHATANQFTNAIPTVDIAIFSGDYKKILLGRKEGEKKYRFIGGFAEAESDNFEYDAKREVAEETGLEIGNLQYVGSKKINDWRYRKESSKIKTLLFVATVIYGAAKAGDDICEVRWFDYNVIVDPKSYVVEAHVELFNMVNSYLEKRNLDYAKEMFEEELASMSATKKFEKIEVKNMFEQMDKYMEKHLVCEAEIPRKNEHNEL